MADIQEQAKEQDTLPFILVAQGKDGEEEITVKDLTVTTPGKNGITLVEHVDLKLKKGQRVILTGESGSGKTTVAKSLLSLWDHGTGIITMPEGMKIMGMAQKAYFPDVTLRSILNLMPEGKTRFEDKELTKALQAVGLNQLVQHIPGQQVELMMNDLLKDIKSILEPFAEDKMTEAKLESIRHSVLARISYLVEKQFNVVQFTPEEQREYFEEKFREVMEATIKNPLSNSETKELTQQALDAIDIALARPLQEKLSSWIKETADRKRPWFSSYKEYEIDVLKNSLQKQLANKLKRYMRNEDTYDIDRKIRINQVQADYIAKKMGQRFSDALEGNNVSRMNSLVEWGALRPIKWAFNKTAGLLPDIVPETVKRPLRAVFNAAVATAGWAFNLATWPLRKSFNLLTWGTNHLSLYARARKTANELGQATTFFMDSQVVKGNELTNGSRLSGGQKQKLMIATVLLHKPDVLILDEITASLDEENAKLLYKDMMDALPGDTIVLSIAHNKYLRQFHTHHAELADHTITMREVAPGEGLEDDCCDSCPHMAEQPPARPEGGGPAMQGPTPG